MEKAEILELEQQAVFQIGDVTVIATAHYSEEGESCFDRISNILRDEVKSGLCTE